MSQLRSGDSDLMQELGDFPDDDLKVEHVEKECRTARHSVPEDGWVADIRQQMKPTEFGIKYCKNCTKLCVSAHHQC